MGAYDDHIAGTSGLNARFHLALSLVAGLACSLNNVTPTSVGGLSVGGADSITALNQKAEADQDDATTLNGTDQGVYVTDAIAGTIMESGGWLSGWYKSTGEQTHPGMVFAITEAAEDDNALWLYVTDQTGFNEDRRTVHLQVRSETGSQQKNIVGLAHCFEHPLGAHIVANLTPVSGNTWRLRVWVNGNQDLFENDGSEVTFERAGSLTGCDTVSFGMVRRNGSDAFWFKGDVSKVSAGSGELTDEQVRAMYNAGRGYTDDDYQIVNRGQTVDTTVFHVDEAVEIPIYLSEPCRVMPFYVVPDDQGTVPSFGINTTFAPTRDGVRGLDGGNDAEMYGQGAPDKTHMGWAHDRGSYAIPAGYHVLTFNTVGRSGSAGVTAKVGAHFSFGEDLPVCGTVNAYSSSTACKLNGDTYWVDSEVGSDDRYVFRRPAAGGPPIARKVSDGIRLNDINHAGGFVLPLGSDLLVGVVGHNDAQIRCSLFTGGDISSAPATTYNIGTVDSRFSYPQPKVMAGTTVGLLIRGSMGEGGPLEAEHASIFLTFDGTDGTGLQSTYIVDTDDGDKTGERGYSIGWDFAVVGGETIIGFLLNLREWSDDRPKSIQYVAWNQTQDTWHLINGDELGVTNTGVAPGDGTRNNPIVSNTLLTRRFSGSAGSKGTLLAIDTDYGVNTLHVPDADAFVMDLTDGVGDMKLLTSFTVADQPASGDYQDSQWYGLTYDSGLTINAFTPFGGIANTTFATAAMSWVDGVMGGEAHIVICNPTTETGSGIDGEKAVPYYKGWGHGSHISWIRTSTPFSGTALSETPVARWVSPGVRTPSNVGVVGGDPNSFAFQVEIAKSVDDIGHVTKSQRQMALLTESGPLGLIDGGTVLVSTGSTGGGANRGRGRSRARATAIA